MCQRLGNIRGIAQINLEYLLFLRLRASLAVALDYDRADVPVSGGHEHDELLSHALGPEIVEPFIAVKRYEIERHRMHVSEWELDEYLQHL